jgi:hypothetical protein
MSEPASAQYGTPCRILSSLIVNPATTVALHAPRREMMCRRATTPTRQPHVSQWHAHRQPGPNRAKQGRPRCSPQKLFDRQLQALVGVRDGMVPQLWAAPTHPPTHARTHARTPPGSAPAHTATNLGPLSRAVAGCKWVLSRVSHEWPHIHPAATLVGNTALNDKLTHVNPIHADRQPAGRQTRVQN